MGDYNIVCAQYDVPLEIRSVSHLSDVHQIQRAKSKDSPTRSRQFSYTLDGLYQTLMTLVCNCRSTVHDQISFAMNTLLNLDD